MKTKNLWIGMSLGLSCIPACGKGIVPTGVLTRPRFCVEWAASGPDSLAWTADGDHNGVPDWVDSTAIHLDRAWDLLHDSLGLDLPLSDSVTPGCPYRVQLAGPAIMGSMDGFVNTDIDGRSRMFLAAQSNGDVLPVVDSGGWHTVPPFEPNWRYMTAVIFHESTHAFLMKIARGVRSPETESMAEWFASTRSGVFNLDPLSDPMSSGRRGIHSDSARSPYINWMHLEWIQRALGTAAVLDWHKFRFAPPHDSTGDDSLFLFWLDSKGARSQFLTRYPMDLFHAMDGETNAKMVSTSLLWRAVYGKGSTILLSLPPILTQAQPSRVVPLSPMGWTAITTQGLDLSLGKARVLVRIEGTSAVVAAFHPGEATTWDSASRAPGDTVSFAAGSSMSVWVHSGADSGVVTFQLVRGESGLCEVPIRTILQDGQAIPADSFAAVQDGNYRTSWLPNPGSTLELDLGISRHVAKVNQTWSAVPSAVGKQAWSISADGTAWVDVVPFQAMNRSLNVSMDTNLSTRAIRMTCQGSAGWAPYGALTDISVWATCEPSILAERAAPTSPGLRAFRRGGSLEILAEGPGQVRLLSPDGRILSEARCGTDGSARLAVPDGVAILRWTGIGKSASRVLSRY